MLDESIVSELEQRETDIKDHLRTLYNLVVDNNFRMVVELGAGQSTYVLTAAVLKTLGDFYSIDSEFSACTRGGFAGTGILQQHSCYHFIEQDDLKSAEQFTTPIDFLFIDSDHEYQHVLDTLRLWAFKVRSGGIIAMHDTDHSFGHAARVLEALNTFLTEQPGLFSVEHRKGCGGLSILKRL